MQTYVAMLRGINVAGHKPVEMRALRESLEKAGFKSVKSYLQSGNVVFQAGASTGRALAATIAARIKRDFGHAVAVIVRAAPEMERVLRRNPFLKEKRVDPAALHVTFLSEVPSKTALAGLVRLPQGADRYIVRSSEIYVFCPHGYGRTKLTNNAFERILGVDATTRNWKTVKALAALGSQ